MAKFKVTVIDADTSEVLAMSEEPTETLVHLLHDAVDLGKEAWHLQEARAAKARVEEEDRILGRVNDVDTASDEELEAASDILDKSHEDPGGYDESDNPSNGWRCPEKGD